MVRFRLVWMTYIMATTTLLMMTNLAEARERFGHVIEENFENNKNTLCFTDDGVVTRRLYKTHKENCTIVYCREEGLVRHTETCNPPPCLDPQLKEGACCSSCPRGVNCRLPNGNTLEGSRRQEVGNLTCICPDVASLSWNDDVVHALCDLITTTTPAPTTPIPDCRVTHEEGEEGGSQEFNLPPGDEKILPKGDDCRKYVCDVSGQLTTYHGDCPEVNCTEATRHSGACCKTCSGDSTTAQQPPDYVIVTPPPTSAPERRFVAMDLGSFFRYIFMHFFGAHMSSHQHHQSGHQHYHPRNVHRTGGDNTGDGTQNGGSESERARRRQVDENEGQNKQEEQAGQGHGQSHGGGHSSHHSSGHHSSGHHSSSHHGNRGHGRRFILFFG